MDLCSLEDAFPNIHTGSVAPPRRKDRSTGSGTPYVGGTDAYATREERRAARKKAKRCKAPAEKYWAQQDDVDPDRPAQIKMESVEAMTNGSVNLYAPPVGQQPLVQPLPSSACLVGGAVAAASPKPPSYFGRGEEDPIEEGDGFSNYTGGYMGEDDSSFRLYPDFKNMFDMKALEKVAGGKGLLSGLPEPNLQDNWKPMAPGATYTAFFEQESPRPPPQQARQEVATAPWSADDLRGDGGTLSGLQGIFGGRAVPAAVVQRPPVADEPVLPAGGNKEEDRDKLLARIDELMGRLEQMEAKRRTGQQHELLLFIGTGLFMLMSLNLAGRCA
jgi:hypothetical protein